MATMLRWVGLDVHAATITVAVAEADGSVRVLGTIPNTAEAVARVVKKLGARESLRVCYEAGPCGYVLYWQLARLGVACVVVAPTLIPMRAGDRVKTDRRDAERLARAHRAGDLTAVWVPDAAHEALRDLVRAREAAQQDRLRARHRVSKYLLRHGLRPPVGVRAWTERHQRWVATLVPAEAAGAATLADYVQEVAHGDERVRRLDLAVAEAVATAAPAVRELVAGLQTLRGVRLVTAVTIATETGPLTRFAHPRQLMGYSGLGSREHSSGPTRRQGGITKTGNAHLRRVLIEASWAYRYRASCTGALRQRQQGQPAAVTAIAWHAQERLCARYRRLLGRGKPAPQVVTAVARELLGFVWAIGQQVARVQAA